MTIETVSELERIESLLKLYVPFGTVRRISKQLLDWSIESDNIVEIILRSSTANKYTYDGLFFTPNNAFGFHRCPDGIRFLQSINETNIPCLRCSLTADQFLEWLESTTMTIMRLRLDHLRRYGTLSLVRQCDFEDVLLAQYEAQMRL